MWNLLNAKSTSSKNAVLLQIVMKLSSFFIIELHFQRLVEVNKYFKYESYQGAQFPILDTDVIP